MSDPTRVINPSPAVAADESWPLTVRMARQRVRGGIWEADRWSIASIETARHRDTGAEPPLAPEADRSHAVTLVLHRDERAAYRFNLTSARPMLFVPCGIDATGAMAPMLVTASQDVAACYMDTSEETVFSIEMPAAIQCWIEAFLVRHGEPEIFLGKGHRRQRGAPRPEAPHG